MGYLNILAHVQYRICHKKFLIGPFIHQLMERNFLFFPDPPYQVIVLDLRIKSSNITYFPGSLVTLFPAGPEVMIFWIRDPIPWAIFPKKSG